MKNSILLISFIFFISSCNTVQNEKPKYTDVEVIEAFENLFKFQNLYLAGQPDMEELQWFKDQGVVKIINLRGEKENDAFAEDFFVEKDTVESMGFKYYSIPVGSYEEYTPEKLDKFIELQNKDEKIVLHCRSAGRANYFLMAYLIKEEGYSVNEAIEVGRQIRFVFSLESLLGEKLSFELLENEEK